MKIDRVKWLLVANIIITSLFILMVIHKIYEPKEIGIANVQPIDLELKHPRCWFEIREEEKEIEPEYHLSKM